MKHTNPRSLRLPISCSRFRPTRHCPNRSLNTTLRPIPNTQPALTPNDRASRSMFDRLIKTTREKSVRLWCVSPSTLTAHAPESEVFHAGHKIITDVTAPSYLHRANTKITRTGSCPSLPLHPIGGNRHDHLSKLQPFRSSDDGYGMHARRPFLAVGPAEAAFITDCEAVRSLLRACKCSAPGRRNTS
jgi:hypothetical protein